MIFKKCKNEIYLIVNLREAGLTKIEEEKWPILEDVPRNRFLFRETSVLCKCLDLCSGSFLKRCQPITAFHC